MTFRSSKSGFLRRVGQVLGVGALSLVLGLALASLVTAQETPEEGETPGGEEQATPALEPTPGPDVQTLIRLEVPLEDDKPIPKGDEIAVQVLLDNVEHLAGFSFMIGYEPDRLEPASAGGDTDQGEDSVTPVGGSEVLLVKNSNLGELLTSSGREEMLCGDVVARDGTVGVICNLLGPPVCAGGEPGVSGSGMLATVYFKSKGGGMTSLRLLDSDLTADDVEPPCPTQEEDEFIIQAIPHRRGPDVTIELAKDSGLSGVVLGVIIAVVVVAGLGAAGGGYIWYRRRQAGA